VAPRTWTEIEQVLVKNQTASNRLIQRQRRETPVLQCGKSASHLRQRPRASRGYAAISSVFRDASCLCRDVNRVLRKRCDKRDLTVPGTAKRFDFSPA